MTKNQELNQEIEQEFAQGNFKPSQLKRSKSAGDISSTPLSPQPLKRTLSQPALKQPNLTQQITQLKQELVFSQQTAQNYLTNLQKAIAELDQKEQQLDSVNQDWLNLAQKQIDNLKKDPNVRITELQQELEETVKDATQEITRQETENKQLRNKLNQTQQQMNDLNQQVNDYQRAAELRINEPKKTSVTNLWWDYAPLILLAAVYLLATWLTRKEKYYD
ncbi:hypothetical protein [endosymbiont GvMRE of Glomus versiforme]|uniref:hypothetical protein n=1 Tax=endosymbiont GvMRE of Glomus versiforme TaxID=2039283 RepID=UPI000EE73B5F|nr:hypothetical protein [endosymbiont GvMRE of Glomus versiforme]RHZ36643.1 hypothetical protein GvMRE_I2g541 [endosymbiont GvMRE of Glomus versiforme]